MNQAYVSPSLAGLDFLTKYNLQPYHDPTSHLFLFGMYRQQDFEILKQHQSTVTVIFQGCDAKDLPKEWIPELKKHKLISISHWIYDSLKNYGLESELKPVSATIVEKWAEVPKGEFVYFYASDDSESALDYYGYKYLEEIKKHFPVIEGRLGKFTQNQLHHDIYPKCFANLRLTTYDGCPNTNLQLGLMGRCSIFNGNIPGSLHWKGIDDILQSIEKCLILPSPSEQIKNYLNITL